MHADIDKEITGGGEKKSKFSLVTEQIGSE